MSKEGNIITYLEIIEDYKNRDKDCYRERYCIRCDKHITYCKNAPTIKEAIVRAVIAKDERGKMNKHQCRVRKSKFKMLIKKLLIKENSIKNVKDFDELINIIIETRVFKSEDSLTYYDTALRLGFYLHKLPRKIYLHAGTRIGVKKIMNNKNRCHFILKKELPKPFNTCDLKEFELEDLFCTYKDEL